MCASSRRSPRQTALIRPSSRRAARDPDGTGFPNFFGNQCRLSGCRGGSRTRDPGLGGPGQHLPAAGLPAPRGHRDARARALTTYAGIAGGFAEVRWPSRSKPRLHALYRQLQYRGFVPAEEAQHRVDHFRYDQHRYRAYLESEPESLQRE